MINSIVEQSILHKAIDNDSVKFDVVDLREFGLGNYRQIDDTPLTEAYEKARNNPMGFFDWRGINW